MLGVREQVMGDKKPGNELRLSMTNRHGHPEALRPPGREVEEAALEERDPRGADVARRGEAGEPGRAHARELDPGHEARRGGAGFTTVQPRAASRARRAASSSASRSRSRRSKRARTRSRSTS